MGISVDGISTGLNTSQLISELSAAYSRPKTLIENKITDYNQLKSDYGTLATKLTAAQTAMEALQGSDKLRSFSSSYSNTDAFDVTLDGDSIPGTYNVEVVQTAKSAVAMSNAIASPSTSLTGTATSISFSYGGNPHTVSIDAGSTLNDVVSSINSNVSGVTAYVMNTGSDYRLIIQGKNTGASNAISSLDLTNLGMSEDTANSISAENAQIKVNGIAIESATNTFLDPIQGMTITAKQSTSSTAVPVTVNLDTTSISNKVKAFVDAYNEAVNFVNARDDYNEDNNTIGSFTGESSVRNILSNLRMAMGSKYTGVGNTSLDSTSQMGFKTNKDGTLSFNSSEFITAYTNYRDDVEALFSKTTGSFAATMVSRLDTFADPLTGQLKSAQTGITNQVKQMTKQVERWETRIIKYEERLRNSFDSLESITGKLNGTKNFLSTYFANNSKK